MGLFESCLTRHNLDGKVFDYTWKQNRLSKDKEALKAQMLGIISRKKDPKKDDTKKEGGEREPIRGSNMTSQKKQLDF